MRVAIDHAFSDPEFIEVKTPEIPGWFQIGSPSMHAVLDGNLEIVSYHANVVIEGVTAEGKPVQRDDSMQTPGFYHVRLPNGEYTARFNAAYLHSIVLSTGNLYVGSYHIPVQVPQQSIRFHITDDDPVVVWMPEMLSLN